MIEILVPTHRDVADPGGREEEKEKLLTGGNIRRERTPGSAPCRRSPQPGRLPR